MSSLPRITTVITDRAGNAALVTAGADALAKLTPRSVDRVSKTPGEAAAPHHPKLAVLLTVLSGSHSIYISGEPEGAVTLNAGDQILFLDFEPPASPSSGYSGHRSQAGAAGAVLYRVMFDVPADFDALDLRPGT